MKQKNIESIYELTPMQEGMLFQVLSESGSSVYFDNFSVQFDRNLNILAMKQAWQEMIKRHSILRTSFHWEGLKKPAQVVHKSVELPWEEKDWRSLSKTEQENSLERFLEADRQRGFNLSKPPLIRLTLIYISENTYQLTFSKHHLLSDGWSTMLLYKEVFEFYDAFSQGQELQLKQPPPFENYITWLKQQKLSEAEDFWKKTLKGFTNPTSIKLYKKFPGNQSEKSQIQHIYLSETETENIKSFTQQYQLTANTLLLGAWSIILHRYNREFDVVFGVNSSGRPPALPEVETMIGPFINTLPMRVNIESDSQLIPWLKSIQEQQVQIREYEYSPLSEIQRWSEIPKGTSLFESIVFFQNFPVDLSLQKSIGNLQVTNSSVLDTYYPLSVSAFPGEKIRLEIEYFCRYFDVDTIQQMLGHLKTLITAITTNPKQQIAQVSMLQSTELNQLWQWNNTEVDYPKNQCLHQLFEEQVKQNPDIIATVLEGRKLTYQELNQKANQLAHYLQKLGVKQDIIVGICIEKSVEMIVAILAVIKAGGIYVPLDSTYPQERLEFMVEDTQIMVLLTQECLLEKFATNTIKTVCLDSNWHIIANESVQNPLTPTKPENTAYIIYTSGSTGKPKGVCCSHLSVINLLTDCNRRQPISIGDNCSFWTSFNFDVSVYEIFSALLAGGTLHIVPEEIRTDPDAFIQWLSIHQIRSAYIPPFALQYLLDWLKQQSHQFFLQRLLIGVEPISQQLVEEICDRIPKLHIINGYGPTETTICATLYSVEQQHQYTENVPIGKPVQNTKIYLLDHHLQPVPIGVPGEIYIGGDGLASGYLNRPELTTEKFIPNPFGNSKLYKTGDLARYLPDGNIEFIGRVDNQVKLRGFRIELGEIETVLKQHPQVREAVVSAKTDELGNQRLIGYVVPEVSLSEVEDTDMEISSATEYFSQIETLYDNFYSWEYSQSSPEINLRVWKNSYTKQPFSEAEVLECVNDTVQRVLHFQPERILEIGCGTGLLLLRIAPHCLSYHGVDISQVALDHLGDQLQKLQPELLSKVKLLQGSAHEIQTLGTDSFDTIIFNEIIQNFPNIYYLKQVLENAVEVVKPGGRIFLGGVRSLPLLELFHASVQLYQASPEQTIGKFKQQVKERLLSDNELVIAPDFFTALKQEIPQISHVEIQLKGGSYHNELTCFKYDVILHVSAAMTPKLNLSKLDWQQEKLTTTKVRQLLEEKPEGLIISGIPNARLSQELQLVELLANPGKHETVKDLQQALPHHPQTGGNPEEMWAMGKELSYETKISWSTVSNKGDYDVIFWQRNNNQGVLLVGDDNTIPQPWNKYANNPQQQKLSQQLLQELQPFLKEKLPEYMIPASFVTLASLPLTPNGKIDRKALPAPDAEFAREEEYVAPSTAIEETLANIWQELLFKEKVSIHDNFFEIGGDSILSIQIVSRAQKAGIKITAKQIFEYQNIAQLALVAETATTVLGKQGVITGSVPLIPIQKSFFEDNLSEPHHFNQSVLLQIPNSLQPDFLSQSLSKLLEHHDALRLRFFRTETGWQQTNQEVDNIVPFEVVNLSDIPESEQSATLSEIANNRQGSLNLSEGPLIRVVLFDLGNNSDRRLLIIIHHLAVDGVSWRILLEDLFTAYQQLEKGQKIQLPPKTTAFQDWALRLQEYANSEILQEQLNYWRSLPWSKVVPLPVDNEAKSEQNTVASKSDISSSLSVEKTRALLQKVPSVYNTQINDVLLTAALLTLSQWIGKSTVPINLEGHGREDLFENIDLSRTVGWFTSLFPVLLQGDNSNELGKTIKSVKEQLRAIPTRGIGYGILRYLTRDSQLNTLPKAQISFNYLGQFDQTQSSEINWQVASESIGMEYSPNDTRSYLLDINAVVAAGKLQVTWKYSRNFHDDSTIEKLSCNYIETLEQLIDHCLSPEAGGYTPSDFPLAQLDQLELDQILAAEKLENIESIYPLSPMQQGILFHVLVAPNSGVYFNQLLLTISGELQVAAFQKAWQKVIERHSILRTMFVWEKCQQPLQIVHQQVDLSWDYFDWQKLSNAEQQNKIETLLITERQQGFALNKAPLMHCTLIRVSEQTYKLLWSDHHILLDGWCSSILFKEFLSFYQAECLGEVCSLPTPIPYKNYIAWLQQQDSVAAETFWRQTLSGFKSPTPLSIDELNSNNSQASGIDAQEKFYLSSAMTMALQAQTREHKLTVFTVIQSIWALLLSCYSGESDVLFGVTVSGRPASLPGVENMVGLFINTLPLRVNVSATESMWSWLEVLQQKQAELQEYSYSPLVEIQKMSELPEGSSLFETIVVFENFPVDRSIEQSSQFINVIDAQSLQKTSSPLILVAAPGDELLVRIDYDGSRFTPKTITQILENFQALLEAIVANSQSTELKLSQLLDIVDTDRKRQQLLKEQELEANSRQMLKKIKRKPKSVL